jgi:restriction system protein
MLDHLLALSPTEFEHAVARLLSQMGYTSVQRIGGAGDDGVDIVCRDAHGGLVAVQCKRYAPGKKVTAPDMATFFGRMVKRHARQGIYVTTSAFTRAAIKDALDTDIRTYDGDGLAKLFARHPAALGLGPPRGQQSGRTSYEKECRYCHRRIQMRVMPDGKWLPFDDVGIPHDCRSRRS